MQLSPLPPPRAPKIGNCCRPPRSRCKRPCRLPPGPESGSPPSSGQWKRKTLSLARGSQRRCALFLAPISRVKWATCAMATETRQHGSSRPRGHFALVSPEWQASLPRPPYSSMFNTKLSREHFVNNRSHPQNERLLSGGGGCGSRPHDVRGIAITSPWPGLFWPRGLKVRGDLS
jgi:hypothetical protein